MKDRMTHYVRALGRGSVPRNIAFLFVLAVGLAASIGTASVWSSDVVWIAPYLQNVTHNSATVVWATNQKLTGEIQVKGATGQVHTQPAKQEQVDGKWLNVATMDNLQEGTCYSYRVLAAGKEINASGVGLCTAAPRGKSFSFAAFGDSGTGLKSQANLATQLLRDYKDSTPLSFLIHTGDIAYPKGSYSEFAKYHFPVYQPLLQLVPIFTTPGNHEYYTSNAAPYYKLHVLPTIGVPTIDAEKYYSFDWGDAHFISIDTNYGSPVASSRFMDWLRKDLAASTARWKIVFFHVPAFSTGKHGPTSLAKEIVPILESGGVDLALQAHDHNIQRTVPLLQGKPAGPAHKGITYIVTGAGSAASYSCTTANWLAYRLCGVTTPVYTRVNVAPNSLTVEQVRETGAVLDKVVIPHQ